MVDCEAKILRTSSPSPALSSCVYLCLHLERQLCRPLESISACICVSFRLLSAPVYGVFLLGARAPRLHPRACPASQVKPSISILLPRSLALSPSPCLDTVAYRSLRCFGKCFRPLRSTIHAVGTNIPLPCFMHQGPDIPTCATSLCQHPPARRRHKHP